MESPPWLPDWRDVSAYRFERLDRAGFAWEWLRRDPAYRDAASARPRGIGVGPAHWGLVRFEPPELASPMARPLWRAESDRDVLVADVSTGRLDGAGALRLDRFSDLLTLVAGERVVHILITDGWRRVRVDLCGRFDHDQPLWLSWRLAGVDIRPQLHALTRFAALTHARQFSNGLWPHDPRVRRWILALRAHDALTAGACHRDIASLFVGDVEAARWRVEGPSLRLRAQRLAALARSLKGGEFAARHLARRESSVLAPATS